MSTKGSASCVALSCSLTTLVTNGLRRPQGTLHRTTVNYDRPTVLSGVPAFSVGTAVTRAAAITENRLKTNHDWPDVPPMDKHD